MLQDKINHVTNSEKMVDFYYLSFNGHAYNHSIAEKLSNILMSYINMDDFIAPSIADQTWTSAVGGGGLVWHLQSQAHQRTLLAAHFSGYSTEQYTHCDISIHEYQCIKDLLEYLKQDIYVPKHREEIINQQINLLEQFCHGFRKAYVKVKPEFLFDMIKETAE